MPAFAPDELWRAKQAHARFSFTAMLPKDVAYELQEALTGHFGKDVSIGEFSPASGGCINNGGRLSTSEGAFFLKWNDAARYPGMFEAEAKGLELLRSTDLLEIPQPE